MQVLVDTEDTRLVPRLRRMLKRHGHQVISIAAAPAYDPRQGGALIIDARTYGATTPLPETSGPLIFLSAPGQPDLRDRIRDVEQVITVQQRLSEFSERHVVLVTPDRQPDRMRLLVIRAGRLVEEVSLPVRATPSHLRYLLRRVYSAQTRPQVSRDELDDLLILDTWLRRHRDEMQEVAVSLEDPQAAAPALRAAMSVSLAVA